MVLQRAQWFVFPIPFHAIFGANLSDSHRYVFSQFILLGWWQYDERTCQEIEEAYKNADKQCTILVAGNLYIVDFDQMLQKRHTDPARKRQVKRKITIFLSSALFFHSESIGDSLISFIQLFLMQFFSLTGDLANVPKKGVAGLRLW